MWGFFAHVVKEALPWDVMARWFWKLINPRKRREPTPWAQPSSHTNDCLRDCRRVLKASDVAMYIFHNGNQPASMKVLGSSHNDDSPIPDWVWDESMDPYNCGVLFAFQWHGNTYFDSLEYPSFPDTQPTDLFSANGSTHILAYPLRSKDRSKTLGSLVCLWTDNIPLEVDAVSLVEDEVTKIEATLHRLR